MRERFAGWMLLVVALLILAALLWDCRIRLSRAEDRAMDARIHAREATTRLDVHREMLGDIYAELRGRRGTQVSGQGEVAR
jgi:hypothetical protein